MMEISTEEFQMWMTADGGNEEQLDVDIPENRVGMNGRIGRDFKRDFRSV